MSKTNLISNGANKQEGLVSVHSKWSAHDDKAKWTGFKTSGQSIDFKRGNGSNNGWGPFFKNRDQFNEMHMF